MHNTPRSILGLAFATVLALTLAACGGDGEPATEPTPSDTAAGASPTPLPGTPEPTRTPVAGAPEGFETSCGSAFPWGEPLPFDFACIDEPRPGVVLIDEFEARGYAASSTGTLMLEVRDSSGEAVGAEPVEWAVETPGALAPWQVTMEVPTNVPPGPAVVTVYLEAADGSRSGEATSEVIVEFGLD